MDSVSSRNNPTGDIYATKVQKELQEIKVLISELSKKIDALEISLQDLETKLKSLMRHIRTKVESKQPILIKLVGYIPESLQKEVSRVLGSEVFDAIKRINAFRFDFESRRLISEGNQISDVVKNRDQILKAAGMLGEESDFLSSALAFTLQNILPETLKFKFRLNIVGTLYEINQKNLSIKDIEGIEIEGTPDITSLTIELGKEPEFKLGFLPAYNPYEPFEKDVDVIEEELDEIEDNIEKIKDEKAKNFLKDDIKKTRNLLESQEKRIDEHT